MSEQKLNRYRCEKCNKSIITVDREDGVTPFMLECKATPGCDGMMTSRFYQVEDVWGPPTFEWRKPSPKQYKRMSPAMKDHVDRGGLCIYPITAASNAPERDRGNLADQVESSLPT